VGGGGEGRESPEERDDRELLNTCLPSVPISSARRYPGGGGEEEERGEGILRRGGGNVGDPFCHRLKIAPPPNRKGEKGKKKRKKEKKRKRTIKGGETQISPPFIMTVGEREGWRKGRGAGGKKKKTVRFQREEKRAELPTRLFLTHE